MALFVVAVMAPRTLLLVVGVLTLLSTVTVASASQTHAFTNCSVVYRGLLYVWSGETQGNLTNITVEGRYCALGATLNILLNATAGANGCSNFSSVLSNITRYTNLTVHGLKQNWTMIDMVSCAESKGSQLFNWIRHSLGLYPALSLGLETLGLYILCTLALSVFAAFYPQMAYVDNALPKTPLYDTAPNKKR
ncbi:Ba67 [Baboon cytomegalovirus]|nr:Ba67 [Baboon cytomegalovirus]